MTMTIVLAILLSVYLVAGAFALRISSRWPTVRAAEALDAKIDSLINVPDSPDEHDFSRYLVMLLMPLRLVLWPLVLRNYLNTVKAAQQKAVAKAVVENDKCRPLWTFADSKADIDLERAEDIGKIFGPLDLVPAVPFGHLNAAWMRFLSHYKTGDVLKHFHIIPVNKKVLQNQWQRQEFSLFGIALTRSGETLAEFVYEGSDCEIDQGPGIPPAEWEIAIAPEYKVETLSPRHIQLN